MIERTHGPWWRQVTGLDAVRKSLTPVLLAGTLSGTAEINAADAPTPAIVQMKSLAEQKEDVRERLEPVWDAQNDLIRARIGVLNERQKNVIDALNKNGLATSVTSFNNEWSPIVKTMHGVNGVGTIGLDDYAEPMKKMEEVLGRWERWDRLKLDVQDHGTYWPEHDRISASRTLLEWEHRKLILTKLDGSVLGMYPDEKKKNPSLTHDDYLDELARVLESPEDLGFFMRYCMWYCHDTTDLSKPTQKGTGASHGEYWQSYGETLERVEEQRMHGDCEDWAMLAKEILTRQRKKAIVTTMPMHATCIWLEKDDAGRYHGWDIGTFGLDHNGNRLGMSKTGVTVGVKWMGDAEKTAHGFDRPDLALESVMTKFRSHREMGPTMNGWQPVPLRIVQSIGNTTNQFGQVTQRTGFISFVQPNELHQHVTVREKAPPPPTE